MSLAFLQNAEIKNYHRWFLDYAHAQCRRARASDQAGLTLKVKHSLRVLNEAEGLCRRNPGLPFPRRSLRIAALLHDVGRFAQIGQYHTMLDRVSVNHGALGVRVLRHHQVLEGLPRAERSLILSAICVHNRAEVPKAFAGTRRALAQALRDADKLDILRVTLAAFESGQDVDSSIFLGLKNGRAYTPELAWQLLGYQRLDMDNMVYMNDFLMLAASWVYDLNHASTLETLMERGWIARLLACLPGEGLLNQVKAQVMADASARVPG